MSVSINDGFKQTLATGGETTIDFDFRIEESTDIRVLKTAVDNTLTELVNPTHYTVPGGSIGVDGGGVINLVTPAVAGEKYTCISNFIETRSTNFSLLGGFQSEELNKQLDRLTRIDQQLRRDINKTVNLREDSTVTGITIPNPVASNLLGWDASATEMVNYAVGDVSGTLDATFTGLTTNDLIKWDGSKWVNTPNIQFSQIDANFIADATTTTPVTTDFIPFADVSNSNNTKKTTIQGVLDLVPAGALVYLGSATASASASLLFEGLISSTYDDYILDIRDLLVATNGTSILLQTSDDAGPYTYDTTGYYNITSQYDSNATTYSNAYSAGTDTGVVLADAIGNVTPRTLNSFIRLARTGSSAFRISFESSFLDNNGYITSRRGFGYLGSGNATTAIRLIAGSGNLTSGNASFFGVKKS